VTVDAAAAFRYCEQVTRARAGNFSYGIRLLPLAKRRALSAVYALARRIDDIGDGDGAGSPEERLGSLEAARASLATISSSSPDPVLAALGHAAARCDLPMGAFEELIDGAQMDVRGTSYRTFDDLEVYARRVAGSIGRLSLGVFGTAGGDRDRGMALADDLGVAMQLTNILRDVREDRATGRVYLPAEDLARFDVPEDLLGEDGREVDRARLGGLIRFEAARARSWFGRGLGLLPLLDARSASCVGAMAGIYRRILDRVERHPEAILRGRVSLPGWEKAWVAARSLAGPRAMAGAGR
jgi:15-cis-phytoene synthase